MDGNYTIQSGDSLSVIAAKHGLTVQQLMEANGIEDANKIKAGASLVIPLVEESNTNKPVDSFQRTTSDPAETPQPVAATAATGNKPEPWENLETLLKNGEDKKSTGAKIIPETGWFGSKTGTYNYTADGSLTYGQLKEQLGLDDGLLRSRNPELFKNITGNADDKTIPKDTVLKFYERDLPTKPVEVKDKDGNFIDGFSKSIVSDRMVYTVQSGDTQEGIYKKFSAAEKDLKGYRTANSLYGYPQETLQAGSKVYLEKKFLGIF